MTSEYSGPPPTRPPEPAPGGQPYPEAQPYPHAQSYPYAQPVSDGPDPAAQPYPYAQSYPPPAHYVSVPARSRKQAWLIGAGGVVLALVLTFLFHPFVQFTAGDVSDDDTVVQASAGVPGPPAPCAVEAPPVNASAAAVAYLAAINAETPAQVAISDRIGSSGYVTSTDLTEQIDSDRGFIRAVKGIAFSATVKPAVTQLLDAITSYDNFLNLAASSGSYYNSHQDEDQQLQEIRSSSAAAVRVALGLPAATCQLDRP